MKEKTICQKIHFQGEIWANAVRFCMIRAAFMQHACKNSQDDRSARSYVANETDVVVQDRCDQSQKETHKRRSKLLIQATVRSCSLCVHRYLFWAHDNWWMKLQWEQRYQHATQLCTFLYQPLGADFVLLCEIQSKFVTIIIIVTHCQVCFRWMVLLAVFSP